MKNSKSIYTITKNPFRTHKFKKVIAENLTQEKFAEDFKNYKHVFIIDTQNNAVNIWNNGNTTVEAFKAAKHQFVENFFLLDNIDFFKKVYNKVNNRNGYSAVMVSNI